MAKVINELSFTKELIKIPSVTPIDAGAINLVAKRLKSLGFKCTILNFKDKNTPTIKNLYEDWAHLLPIFVLQDIPM